MRPTVLLRTIWVLGSVCLISAIAWGGGWGRAGRRDGREAREAQPPAVERSSGQVEKATPQPGRPRSFGSAFTPQTERPREERPALAPRPDALGGWGRGHGSTGLTPWSRGEEDVRPAPEVLRGADSPLLRWDGRRQGWRPGEMDGRGREEPVLGGQSESGARPPSLGTADRRGGDEEWRPTWSLRSRDGSQESGREQAGAGPERQEHKSSPWSGVRHRPEAPAGEQERTSQRESGATSERGRDSTWRPGWSLRSKQGGEAPGDAGAAPGRDREDGGPDAGLDQRRGPALGERWTPGERSRDSQPERRGEGRETWRPGWSLRTRDGSQERGPQQSTPQPEERECKPSPWSRVRHGPESAPGERDEAGKREPDGSAERERGGAWRPGWSLRSKHGGEARGEAGATPGGEVEKSRPGADIDHGRGPALGERGTPGESSRDSQPERSGEGREKWRPGWSLRTRDGSQERGPQQSTPQPEEQKHKPSPWSRVKHRPELAPGERDGAGQREPDAEAERGRDAARRPGWSARERPEPEKLGDGRAGERVPGGVTSRPHGPEGARPDGPRPEKFPGWRPGATRDWEAIRRLAHTPPRPGEPPRLFVDGRELRFPHPPRLHDGHPVAPAGPFVEKLGGRMWYDHKSGYWHACHRDRVIRFRVGDRHAYCGDRLIILVVPPYLVDGYVYCPIEPFAFYFGVRYHWHYYWTPPVYYSPYISERRAISIARDYLMELDEYPYRVTYVDASRKLAPANHFWEAVTSGYEPLWDAPERLCWVVEFGYRRGDWDGWKQVFVDAHTGRVVGGWDSEYEYYEDW
ncbi:MAG: stalk domain-containing protein [Armatimonadetes bacterium]|nr:stalk domain-containing protein [Armatimonadota bacterium]